jgi:hypothetical protein
MNPQVMTKRIAEQLQRARTLFNRFNGYGKGDMERSEFERIIRLHCEAEMAKFTAAVQTLVAKAERYPDQV